MKKIHAWDVQYLELTWEGSERRVTKRCYSESEAMDLHDRLIRGRANVRRIRVERKAIFVPAEDEAPPVGKWEDPVTMGFEEPRRPPLIEQIDQRIARREKEDQESLARLDRWMDERLRSADRRLAEWLDNANKILEGRR